MTAKHPMGASLIIISIVILGFNLVNSAAFIGKLAALNNDATAGGEVTEIVSAPESAKEASFPQSALGVLTANASSAGIFEDRPLDDWGPLMTGGNSLLQNQNPVTMPTPEPKKPAPKSAPYYGPSLSGYFIFPTTGYNQGRLHSYNAIVFSRGDDCLYEDIPVFAAASGVITATYPTQSAARWANNGYGNYFIILHPNGVTTLYSHLKTILVNAGQYVYQGSIVAFMGGYPRTPGAGNSTGCHLHFGVRGAAQPFAR